MTATAVLIKRRTDNGYFEIAEGVPPGKEYAILPQTARELTALHESGTFHRPRMVLTTDGQWLPVELLD